MRVNTMASTADIRRFAEQLSDVLSRIEDLKIEGKSLLETAKEQGIDTKALAKIAKELATESGKLRKQYEGEAQLEMFRSAVKIHERKGLKELETA
jgi:hypothetical protein